MTMLHDRLADLADDAPTARHDPDLWDRGRRYQRRRRGGTLAIVGTAAVLLALLGGVGWQRSAPPVQPATGSVGLPDRVWNPSPWLPSTDRPGRLVALTTADQASWTGMHPGVVGVSATTGQYAFLDLPGAVRPDLNPPALTPDGRHLAYWITGGTTGTPNTSVDGDLPVTGVGVLDTETGAVSRHWISTAHGLMVDSSGLLWADDQTLVISFAQYVGGDGDSDMDQSSAHFAEPLLWHVTQDEVEPWGLSPTADAVTAVGGRVLTYGDREGLYRLVDLDRPRRVRTVDVGKDFSTTPVMDAEGNRVAVVAGHTRVPGASGKNPNVVRAGALPERPGRARLTQVPHSGRTSAVLTWLDARHLVVIRHAADPSEDRASLFRVSLPDGWSKELVKLPQGSYGGGWQFATDLLGAPSAPGQEPPSPLDPRWVAGTGLITLVAAGWSVIAWRRRVRP